LRQLIEQEAFAAVVTHGSWPHIVIAPVVQDLRCRLVYMAHDAVSRQHWLNRWAARTQPDALIANSHFTVSAARQLFPNVHAEVVYLPLPISESADRCSSRQAIRALLGTSEQTVVILQVSRLEQLKGQAVHIAALGRLRDLQNWEAWFVGGPQKGGEQAFLAQLRQQAHQFGVAERVRFLGQRQDVPALMAAADIYCQPNTGPESFGLTFVEALSVGLPVVTSAIGGAAEIVTSQCGILCCPGDVQAVANALRLLISDSELRRSLGAAGPQRALSLCEPRRQINALARAVLGVGVDEPH
jgi:glycosyltransferase involved in cell wall biosynthesis